MELVAVIVLIGLACWVYSSGKQTGSRKGFAAGRYGRRRWVQTRPPAAAFTGGRWWL